MAIYDRRQRGDAAPERATLELARTGDAWALTSAHDYPVIASKVTDLLAKLGGLQARGPIASGPGRAKQLAVADDLWERKIVVTTPAGDRTFLVGSAAGARRTAFRIGGQDAIYGTDLTAGGVSVAPTGWIDTSYAKFDKADVVGVAVTKGGSTIELDKRSGSWAASVAGQPVVPKAGDVIADDVLDRVVTQLASINVAAPGDPARPVPADATTVVVTFKAPAPAADAAGSAADPAAAAVSAPEPQRTFTLSLEGDKYWVREDGNPRAALVNKGALEVIVSLERDRLTKAKPDPAAAPAGGGLERPAGMPLDMPMPDDLPPGLGMP
ncbi:MAG: DUF4340 domain-containing protein [Kofleriaceae bacterium]